MIRLSDFITKIRNCKTMAEQRAETQKEMSLIRESFNKNEENLRLRNVTKLLFINMMGQDTDFGQMECLKLISAHTFIEKRIGYLGLTQLFDENSPLLMMATNRIKIDLSSQNNYILGLTLCVLSEICTEQMAEDVSMEVLKLTTSPSAYIKKKAFLTAGKLIKKAPQHIPEFLQKAELALDDKSHGVQLGVLGFLETVVQHEEHIDRLVKFVPKLEKVYKNLMSSHSPEYEVSGTNDPFLQVGILHFLRHLYKVAPQIEANFITILLSAREFILEVRNSNNAKNGANAVLFECFQGLVGMENTDNLKEAINSILSRFVSVKDANSKYLTLYTLSMLSKTDIEAVEPHRGTIFECLSENDKLIRIMALDMLYVVANNDNVVDIIRDLEGTLLRATDEEFIPELATRICLIVDKHSPSRRWTFDTILKVLIVAGQSTRESSAVSLIHLVTSTPQLQSYAIIKIFFAATSHLQNDSLNKIALYLLGEFTPVLLNNKEVKVSEDDVLNLVENILIRVGVSDDTIGYGLNCLLKLFDKVGQKKRVLNLINFFKDNPSVEVQKRSLEYSKLVSKEWDGSRNQQICVPMPALTSAAEIFRNIPIGSTEGALEQTEIVMPRRVEVPSVENAHRPQAAHNTHPAQTNQVVHKSHDAHQKQEWDIFGGDDHVPAPVSQKAAIESHPGISHTKTQTLYQPSATVHTPQPKSDINIFEDLFANDTKPQPVQPPKQEVASVGALNLYGNQTHQQTGLAGLNLYGNQPANSGLNFLGNNGGLGSLNITMQTGGIQPQAPLQPSTSVHQVENNLTNLNFLGTTNPSVSSAPNTSFLGMTSSAPSNQSFKAFENQHIRITMICSKESVDTSNLVASFSNKTGSPIDNLVFQVAFTKHLKILSNSLSNTNLLPNSNEGVQQRMKLVNSSPQDKSLIMKLKFKLLYSVAGQKVSEEGMIGNFPQGF